LSQWKEVGAYICPVLESEIENSGSGSAFTQPQSTENDATRKQKQDA
jgi:hypothetical protein